MKPPSSCHACTALIVCLCSDRLDELGQMHLDAVSRLSVDLPRMRQRWYLEDAAESRMYAARGEGSILQELRAQRSYNRVFYPADEAIGQCAFISEAGEYDPDLDGDPETGW